MTEPPLALLAEIVDRYDEDEQPVTPAMVSNSPDERSQLRSCFESFEAQCLLTTVEGGYRPTVTARELLELDINEDELVFVDCDPAE